jgi:hypothetical protein
MCMVVMHKGCTDNQFYNVIVKNVNLINVTVPWWDVDLSSNFEVYHCSLDYVFDIYVFGYLKWNVYHFLYTVTYFEQL